MTGKEFKNIIEKTALGKTKIANAMGISMQTLAQYYKTVDMRQETINKLDKAIYTLTNKKKRLSDYTDYMPREMGSTIAVPPIGTNEQQMDALGFAADQVGKMTSAFIVALDRVRKREAELDEQIERVSRLEELISRNLEALSKHFNYENSLFNGVGGLTLPDMASEDIPKPNKNNEDYDKI